MASSDITVAALTATPTVRGNKLAWTYSDPRSGAVPNIALDMVEVHASTTNDRATATKVGEGITDFLHTGLVEEQTWYYWIKARNYLGHFGDWHPSGSTAGVSATAIGMSGLAFGLGNGKIKVDTNGTDATVASNAIRIAIKTAAGTDPSSSDPVFIAFPNSDVTIGNYQIRRISAALSITIPEFKHLGVATDDTPFRIWVLIFDDAGTLRVGVKVASNSAALISPIAEDTLASSSAVSGATSSYTYYTDVAVTSKPLRIIGELIYNSGLPTAALWTALPSATRLIAAGTKRPGSRVPAYSALDLGSYAIVFPTPTAVVPFDDSIPQIGEGVQLDSFSYTARAACNIIEVESIVNLSHSVASEVVGALFVDGASNAVASDFAYVDTAGKLTQITLKFRVLAGSVSSRTYSIRIGTSQAGTMTLNGSGGARKFGGVLPIVTNADEIEG